jgi:sporulation protein YlmC with PRC-barrel domain
METLTTFLIVFVPFGWFMWKMLRYTRDTIGSNSPMKVSRFYETTAWWYFVRMDNLFVFYALLLGILLYKVSLFGYFSYTVDYQALIRFGMLMASVFFFVVGFLIFTLELNYWYYAKDITIETFPESHELEIAFKDVVLRLKDGDIEKLVIHHNNNYRMPLGYAKCYLTNGDHFIIPNYTRGEWVIREYFKKIPVEYVVQRFPFVR